MTHLVFRPFSKLTIGILLIFTLLNGKQISILFLQNLGYIYLQKGDYLHAQQIFASLHEQDSAQIQESVAWGYGLSLFKADMVEDTIPLWQYNDLAINRVQHLAYLYKNRLDDQNALEQFTLLAQIDPTSSDAWAEIGRIEFDRGVYDQAAVAYDHALKLDQFTTTFVSDLFYRRGKLYQLNNQYTEASLSYDRALQVNRFSTIHILSKTYYEKGELIAQQNIHDPSAIDMYQLALDHDPNNRWAQLRYGYTHYWQIGDITTAVAYITNVANHWDQESNVNAQWAYYFIGKIYADAGQIENARSAYETALTIAPSNEVIANEYEKLRNAN